MRQCFDSEPHASEKTEFLRTACEKRDIKFQLIYQFLITPSKENFKKTFTHFYKRVFSPRLLQNKPNLYSEPNPLITPKIKYECKPLPLSQNTNIVKVWYKTEREGMKNFEKFLKLRLLNYGQDRDFPAMDATSKISAYLRAGGISHIYVYLKALEYPESEKFIKEIAWSEFYRTWLYLYPEVVALEYRENWRQFPWKHDFDLFEKWKNGQTGYDIVDAGMMQLKQEGWMHNRVRMVTASFLVKNLMIDWRWGEQFFYKNLVDADLAQNVGNWQWVAGCGLDAAPYFRIFNPSVQLQKFDSEKKYTSRYLKHKESPCN